MNDQQQSRADALTEAERLLLARVNDCTKPIDAADRNGILKLIDRLAACPVEQPAAAPIDKRCVGWAILNGVCVVDFSRDRAEADRTACEMQRSHDLSGSLASFHVEPVFIRTDAAPVPSPADERAAFEDAFRAAHEFPEHADRLTFRKGWEAAIMWQRRARAASANETGAEVAQWQSRLKDRSSPVVDHWVNISPDGAKTLMEKYANVYEVRALYAAPQPPAQADARVGLTDAQRSTLESLARTSTPYEQEVLRSILATHPGQPEPRTEVTDTEPQWIVNDLGELGVKVGGRFFFLYKGDNIEYGASSSRDGIALHDDGSPMQYRIVGKREFGETCLPVKWVLQGRSEDRYHEKLVYHPGLSFGKPEDGDWKLLPAARTQGGES
ncbi:hypothetical protein L0Y93_06025 [Burkholderia multivorans]|uniref:hypothetical protein n=1 Tax=Burkholderia multivorans TaxID=87883 RepID=UPI00207D6092|nr:hypothetical protein [Burkholderia multivorans]MCO1461179.1 hypothetical protein [Burkholderia multivorans]